MKEEKSQLKGRPQKVTWEQLLAISQRSLDKAGIKVKATRFYPDDNGRKEIIFLKNPVSINGLSKKSGDKSAGEEN